MLYPAHITWQASNSQLDWVTSVILITQWLESNCGRENVNWAWTSDTQVSFAREVHRSLFLLNYAQF